MCAFLYYLPPCFFLELIRFIAEGKMRTETKGELHKEIESEQKLNLCTRSAKLTMLQMELLNYAMEQ